MGVRNHLVWIRVGLELDFELKLELESRIALLEANRSLSSTIDIKEPEDSGYGIYGNIQLQSYLQRMR